MKFNIDFHKYRKIAFLLSIIFIGFLVKYTTWLIFIFQYNSVSHQLLKKQSFMPVLEQIAACDFLKLENLAFLNCI